MWWQFKPYVPVAQRRAQAAREVQKRRRAGQTITPVVIEGRTIARTFWGKAWCDNLELYSDYANRLPRGRTYVRNGSVVDLQIEPGQVKALVSGSELYEVEIAISTLPEREWAALKSRCAGQIGSLVELLQGKLAKGVIEIVTDRNGGLFPRPSQIEMSCSCPDSAGMCKHIAAVMYGIGARLDEKPELLFVLRKVDHLELIEEAAASAGKQPAGKQKGGKKTVADADLAGVFGIELAGSAAEVAVPASTEPVPKAKRGRGVKSAPEVPPSTEPVPKARRTRAAKPKASAPAPEPAPKSAPRTRATRGKKSKDAGQGE